MIVFLVIAIVCIPLGYYLEAKKPVDKDELDWSDIEGEYINYEIVED